MKLIIRLFLCLSIAANSFGMQKKRPHNKLSKSADCIHSQEYVELQQEKHTILANAEKTIGKKLTKFSNAHAPLFKVIPPKVIYPLDPLEPESSQNFFEKNKNAIILGGIGLGIAGVTLIASQTPSSQTSKL